MRQNDLFHNRTKLQPNMKLGNTIKVQLTFLLFLPLFEKWKFCKTQTPRFSNDRFVIQIPIFEFKKDTETDKQERRRPWLCQ